MVAFCIFKKTLRLESADKKRTIIFVFEIWYKNLRTFIETFPQGYLYCILVDQRPFLGNNVGKVFVIISIFWVVQTFSGRLLDLQSINPGEHCKEIFPFAEHLICNAFFLWRTFGFYNLWKSAGLDRKIPARMSKSLVTFSKLHHLGKQIPDKHEQFWFFYWVRTKKVSSAVKLLSSYPEEFLLEEKRWNYKKKHFRFWMINYPILSKYFLSGLPRLHDTSP